MRIAVLEADPAWEHSRAREGGAEFLAQGLRRAEMTVAAVTAVLERDGHTVIPLPVDADLPARVVRAAPRLVFNTYFGPARREDQAHVASLLEYAGVPFSGGSAACHFVGLSKPLSKTVFSASGVPTARFFSASTAREAASELDRARLPFPLLVKASQEGEGIGLDERSVVHGSRELGEAIERVRRRFSGAALVEEFLPGREFTVGVLDGRESRILPFLEIKVPPDGVFSFEAKTRDAIEETCPAELPEAVHEEASRLALRAGRLIGCRDCWRVDFRLDAAGSPKVLEVNALPGLQPGYSDLTRMVGPAGMTYADLVRSILQSADARRAGR